MQPFEAAGDAPGRIRTTCFDGLITPGPPRVRFAGASSSSSGNRGDSHERPPASAGRWTASGVDVGTFDDRPCRGGGNQPRHRNLLRPPWWLPTGMAPLGRPGAPRPFARSTRNRTGDAKGRRNSRARSRPADVKTGKVADRSSPGPLVSPVPARTHWGAPVGGRRNGSAKVLGLGAPPSPSPEFHDAHGVGGLALVGDHILG